MRADELAKWLMNFPNANMRFMIGNQMSHEKSDIKFWKQPNSNELWISVVSGGQIESLLTVSDRVHPTEMCYTCREPGLLGTRCRCAAYCIKCSNGHEWHTCTIHKTQVSGAHNHNVTGCSCND